MAANALQKRGFTWSTLSENYWNLEVSNSPLVVIEAQASSTHGTLFLKQFSSGRLLLTAGKEGRKGKEVDGETQVAIDKLQESIEKSAEAAKETFHSLFGKESPTPRSSTSTYAPAHPKVRNENDHNQDDDLYGDQDDDDDLQDDQDDDDQEDVQDDDDLQEDDFHDPEHDEYYDDQH
ncbi:hypothetical protein P8452_13146 [Trifolium repens]|nr:hypothetical protein P8452_13146 [Trifolium repens]